MSKIILLFLWNFNEWKHSEVPGFFIILSDVTTSTCFLQDWQQDNKPDADDKGFFNTSLPVIVFNMVEENVS